MAYNQTNYQRNSQKGYSGSSSNRSNNPRDNQVKLERLQINIPLYDYFKDRAEIFLPDGLTEQAAQAFCTISKRQLRKVLNTSKEALAVVQKGADDIETAQRILFMILPMAAYNKGRAGSKERPAFEQLFNLMKDLINTKSIRSEKDIKMFDQIITSIVAYHSLCFKSNS